MLHHRFLSVLQQLPFGIVYEKFISQKTVAIWEIISGFMDTGTVCACIVGSISCSFRFIIRKTWLFGDQADNVHTESVHTFFEPPVHHIVNFLAYNRIFPVQVRLFFGEQMQVIHICCFVIFPCRTGETGTPVVWKASVFFYLCDRRISWISGEKESVIVRRLISENV